MSDSEEPTTFGKIAWCDLTVPNADSVKDFYQQVTGWNGQATAVEDYQDWTMYPTNSEGKDSGSAVAGICHQKGPNKDLPSVWMVYITVENVRQAAEKAIQAGGKVLRDPGDGPVAVVQDPAGAVFALYQTP